MKQKDVGIVRGGKRHTGITHADLQSSEIIGIYCEDTVWQWDNGKYSEIISTHTKNSKHFYAKAFIEYFLCVTIDDNHFS